MVICIAGKNNISVECADWLLMTGRVRREDLIVCANRTDDGLDGHQKSLRQWASRNNVAAIPLCEVYQVVDLIFFSLEFDRIVKPEKFGSSRDRLFNIHFSDLPKYKGVYTSAHPILRGETQAGVTLHCIDSGIDTGDIVAQILFSLPTYIRAFELYELYTENGIKLFKNNFDDIVACSFHKQPQPYEGSTYFSRSSIDYANLKIDLNRTAFEVTRQVNAFVFPQYQLPELFGEQIEMAQCTPHRSDAKPGKIVRRSDRLICIATIDFDVELILAAKSN